MLDYIRRRFLGETTAEPEVQEPLEVEAEAYNDEITPERYIFLNLEYQGRYLRVDGRGAIAISGADTVEELLSRMAKAHYAERVKTWSSRVN